MVIRCDVITCSRPVMEVQLQNKDERAHCDRANMVLWFGILLTVTLYDVYDDVYMISVMAFPY